MANNVNTSPAYIDTAGGDVTVSSTQTTIAMISLTDNGAGAKKAVFIDNDSNVVAIVQTAASSTTYWVPASPAFFENGFIFDDSASSVATNDIVLVYEV